jgi:putative DNA primase/helicase
MIPPFVPAAIAADGVSIAASPAADAWGKPDMSVGDNELPSMALLDGVLTERQMAEIFTEKHGALFRFCHSTEAWFRWDGTRWAREQTNLVIDQLRAIGKIMARQYTSVKDQKDAGRSAFLSGAERLARADRAHAVTAENWDRDPFLLAAPGGCVDLRSGEIFLARPDDYQTMRCNVAPDFKMDCPRWIEFLFETFGGDDELIAFIQRWFGYCLTGAVNEHKLAFCYGSGGNGKSVLLNTASWIMGDYATNSPIETFAASHGDRHPTELARLRSKRLVITSETEENRSWAEARIKAVTGGDPITARFMYQNFFEYDPQFKLTISGNHKPRLRNIDDAARRRFCIIPFDCRPENPDPDLPEKLKAEAPAILAWMIRGCLKWQAEGLAVPDVVKVTTEEYFKEQDVLGQWLEETCEINPKVTTPSKALYNNWRQFALERGVEPRSMMWFVQELVRRGYPKAPNRFKQPRAIRGLVLNQQGLGEMHPFPRGGA